MKELKFTCPSCGQHVQCDGNHAGENVPCPGCAVLIRVPPEASVIEVPESPTEPNPFASGAGDSEKVSYTRTITVEGGEEKESTTQAEHPVEQRLNANPVQPVTLEPPVTTTKIHASELDCVCPVCRSRLRISLEAGSNSDTESSVVNLAEQSNQTPHTGAEHLSPAEREHQIAAARTISLRSTMKPRLDQILTDAHVPSEHDAATQSAEK